MGRLVVSEMGNGGPRYLGAAFLEAGLLGAAFFVLALLAADFAVDFCAVDFEPGSTVATPGPGENRLSWPSAH